MDVETELECLAGLFRIWDGMRERGYSVAGLEREVPLLTARISVSSPGLAESLRWWLERDLRKMKEREMGAALLR